MVAWAKGAFRGREALEAVRAAGPDRTLHGVRIEGRRPAREGTVVLDGDGTTIGAVTSVSMSAGLAPV